MPKGGRRSGAGRKGARVLSRVERNEIAEWCWRRHIEASRPGRAGAGTIVQPKLAPKMSQHALREQHRAAEAKREEIIKARRGQHPSEVAKRISEKVGPMLDATGRFIVSKPGRVQGVRARVLIEASAQFGLPTTTIDSIWKRHSASARYWEWLLRSRSPID